MDDRVLRELPPLLENDFMYVADRRKKEFTYPIHKHEVFELNYVENGEGVLRIVGDSSETIGNRELVLITSPDLEHVWSQGTCNSEEIREITIQFFFNFNSSDSIFCRTPMLPIKHLFEKARKGVAFTPEAIEEVYPLLNSLSTKKDKFYSVIDFLTILYKLSLADGTRELATSSFAKVDVDSDSRRILKVKDYISKHFTHEIRLAELADLVGIRLRRSAVSSSFAPARRSATTSWRCALAWQPDSLWTRRTASARYVMVADSTRSATSTAFSVSIKVAAPRSFARNTSRRRLSCKALMQERS